MSPMDAFVADMAAYSEAVAEVEDPVACGEEALSYAMTRVRRYPGGRWFGAIGHGSFYCDGDGWRWFRNTDPATALQNLAAEGIDFETEE